MILTDKQLESLNYKMELAFENSKFAIKPLMYKHTFEEGFKAAIKEIISMNEELSKLHKHTVIDRFCSNCGNTKMFKGDGSLEQLCTC